MVARADASAIVDEALSSLWPGRFDQRPLTDDLSLGSEGIGLDSIEIVELLLECEALLGASPHAEELLEESGPVTVGALVDRLARP